MNKTNRFTITERSYRYACAESSVGRLLIVMTEDGVVDVIPGDSLRHSLSAASARHPRTTFIPDNGVHAQWVTAVVRRIEQPGSGGTVPFDLGTGFRNRAAS